MDVEDAKYYTLDLGIDLSMFHIHEDWSGDTMEGNDVSLVHCIFEPY